jgi:hypothetical protein
MKRVHKSSRAILVLECPWHLDATDSNRSSVLPFVEGIAKFAGDVEVYHANFYDKASLGKALSFLCTPRDGNTLVYVAAHGLNRKVGGVDVGELLYAVGEYSQSCNITGVMLGSCFVGKHTATLEAFLQETNLRWCAGYSSESDWLVGTMIDCSILGRMIDLDDDDLASKETLIERLGEALQPFAADFIIGNDSRARPVALKDSIQFVVQPKGKGQRAKTVTAEVLAHPGNQS